MPIDLSVFLVVSSLVALFAYYAGRVSVKRGIVRREVVHDSELAAFNYVAVDVLDDGTPETLMVLPHVYEAGLRVAHEARTPDAPSAQGTLPLS